MSPQCAVVLAKFEKIWKLSESRGEDLAAIGGKMKLVNSPSPPERQEAIDKILEETTKLQLRAPLDQTLENSLSILGEAVDCNIIVWSLEGGRTNFVTMYPEIGFMLDKPVLNLFQEIQEVPNQIPAPGIKIPVPV